MQKVQSQIIVILSLLFVVENQSAEFGKHDGAEYCYYVPGDASGRVYPTAEERKSIVDDYYDCDVDAASIHRDHFVGDMDFEATRKAFPIFKQQVNGYPFIYLDSGSTAQMPQVVLDAIVNYYKDYKSNIGRGIYDFAAQTTEQFELVRSKVAAFIGAKKQEIIFVPGTTAGINLVARAWADHAIHAGDEILVSELEHNANYLPWQQLALRNDAVLKIMPVNAQGVVEIDVLEQYISNKTKLVALVHQSNVLGSVNDIQALTEVAHRVGAKVLVDAAQSIVHQKIDVTSLDCDFLSFGAHKIYGPTGIGALFVKESLMKDFEIQHFGGGMVYYVGHSTEDASEFKAFPHALESGTQPIAQVIGLGAAIDFVQQYVDLAQAQEHETRLVRCFAKQLQDIPGVTIISPIPAEGEHNNLVTFISDNCHAYDIAEYLNRYGIAVRAGYHCVHIYHENIGGRASVRVSFSIYNTEQEVDFVIEKLQQLLM